MPAKLTAETFVQRSIARYGKERFDYSQVNYAGSKVNVRIKCTKCDITFSTRPASHLRADTRIGCCPSCLERHFKTTKAEAMRDKYAMTKDQFIEKAIARWKDRFEYSEVRYINSKVKVKIRCKKHQLWFEIAPSNHTIPPNGPGCRKCKIEIIKEKLTLSQSEYEEICNEVHYDDYSYGEYKGIHEQIQIYCNIHGWFSQNANDHRRGSKCQKCAFTERGEKIALSLEEFVSRAEAIHDFRYTYEKTTYIRSHIPITITCQTHGDFERIPALHLAGSGCHKCYKPPTKTTEEFIEAAKAIHGGKYSYDNTEYVGTKEPVLIHCPTHGKFLQVPSYHLSGNGCAACGHEEGGKDGLIHFMENEQWSSKPCKLYLVSVGEYQKIGIAKDIKKRARSGKKKYGLIKAWDLTRAEAWSVEQYFLHKTIDKKPKRLTEDFVFWPGRTELREFNYHELDELEKSMEQKVSEVRQKGWLDFATDHRIRPSSASRHFKYTD
jgi:hypothetical protein